MLRAHGEAVGFAHALPKDHEYPPFVIVVNVSPLSTEQTFSKFMLRRRRDGGRFHNMNFSEFETPEKLRGGFYTDPDIADFLARWVCNANPRRVLEPSCGDGAFIQAVQQRAGTPDLTILAYEIDPGEAAKARYRASGRAEVVAGDFLRSFLFQIDAVDRFDAVVGNPPFIRYQYLPEEQQHLAERIFKRFGLRFTKHTNAWVPFVVAAVASLRPGGRLAMVVPSEILHIPHAQSLRGFLTEQCARVLVVDPDEIWFSDTLQGTVLLMAEKKHDRGDATQGVAVVPVRGRECLNDDPEALVDGANYVNGDIVAGKWMPLLLSREELELLGVVSTNPRVRRFRDVASVDVGIVTGANKFFLVPDKVVDEFGLAAWAHPMFGRSEHVRGLVYSANDHLANREAGLPANFLWFPAEESSALPTGARAYLDLGLRQQLHARYKCRVRTPWYRVPSVYLSPVGMLKRAHNFPRLILNSAGAYTTDTAYRIQPMVGTAEALVCGFVNSLTCLSAELEGRHYGGGVLELVPSEIERLLVPMIDGDAAHLSAADTQFRETQDELRYLRRRDREVLGAVGLDVVQQEILHSAWLRLRARRHRTPAGDAAASDAGQ